MPLCLSHYKIGSSSSPIFMLSDPNIRHEGTFLLKVRGTAYTEFFLNAGLIGSQMVVYDQTLLLPGFEL